MDPSPVAELFPHVRIVMGTVIGLAITRILMTVAGIIQHPQRGRRSLLHLLWMGSMLLELVLFWWWEFALHQIEVWHFGLVVFIIGYAITLFLMAAMLSPDSISEYTGFEDFFIKRRHWFFGLLAATFLLDTIDTLIKGQNHWPGAAPTAACIWALSASTSPIRSFSSSATSTRSANCPCVAPLPICLPITASPP